MARSGDMLSKPAPLRISTANTAVQIAMRTQVKTGCVGAIASSSALKATASSRELLRGGGAKIKPLAAHSGHFVGVMLGGLSPLSCDSKVLPQIRHLGTIDFPS